MWTPERIEQMFDYVARGYSASQIASFFHTTRNAVIGKIQRERIKRGHVPAPRGRAMPRVAVAKPAEPAKPADGIGFILPTLPAARKGPAIGILDVTGCRWPLEDDPAVIGGRAFCNAPQKPGRSYCPQHCRINRSNIPVRTWLKGAMA